MPWSVRKKAAASEVDLKWETTLLSVHRRRRIRWDATGSLGRDKHVCPPGTWIGYVREANRWLSALWHSHEKTLGCLAIHHLTKLCLRCVFVCLSQDRRGRNRINQAVPYFHRAYFPSLPISVFVSLLLTHLLGVTLHRCFFPIPLSASYGGDDVV